MTGANRLLIGLGWSSVVFIAWYRTRRKRAAAATSNGDAPVPVAGREPFGIRLTRPHSVEVAFLAAATLYSLTLPLKHSIMPIDAVVLVGLFVLYMIRLSKAPPEEPHLVGPARWVGGFSPAGRRTAVGVMFLWAAIVILLCAEPFAHALVETGHDFGISEFFLVQWLAPLASEAPEFIVAGLFAWRLQTNAALGALVSSKVNQWTLLVGSLPLVFMIASGSLHGLPIEGTQRLELLLTASQSLFAVAIITNLRMSVGEAWWIFLLFWAQFLVSAFAGERLHDEVLIVTSVIYLAMGIWLIATHWTEARALLKDGFRTPYAAMATGDVP
jgi:cation:H+ antiporter